MSDGWHLDRYETGYQHGWVEALEAALEAVEAEDVKATGHISDGTWPVLLVIRRLLEEAREP